MIDWSRMITAAAREAGAQRQAAAADLAAALATLAETDWMVIREAEEGVPLPDDARAARKAARAAAGTAGAALAAAGAARAPD